MSELLSKAIQDRLAKPFQNDEIKWLPKITKKGPKNKRVDIFNSKGEQVAGCMAHIDARQVMQRLDDVVGAIGWSDEYQPAAVGKGVECRLTVLGVSKVDVGVPSNTEPEKGAYSDALKRAAVKFGIGRHLYDIDTQWFPFDGWKITRPQPQQSQPPATNGATGPLPDDEQVIMETQGEQFFIAVTGLIDRFKHENHTKAAAKKLGVTAIPGKPDDRRELYLRLKEYGRARDAEDAKDDDDANYEGQRLESELERKGKRVY